MDGNHFSQTTNRNDVILYQYTRFRVPDPVKWFGVICSNFVFSCSFMFFYGFCHYWCILRVGKMKFYLCTSRTITHLVLFFGRCTPLCVVTAAKMPKTQKVKYLPKFLFKCHQILYVRRPSLSLYACEISVLNNKTPGSYGFLKFWYFWV